ncbi:GNAT family N-acetyltransferase [Knoellia koreensis]|uniref:N-acetyltransferase n=1 Tax=Knoellia koreensis TaxID=2730921 RepID=A0A849HQ85_9MICO|nr:GNAT family N-acetyltransferase [Knoellia sp. DB2414S]NNM46757.1 N-acetyltransferase [Knoellia sp. DB2414S]
MAIERFEVQHHPEESRYVLVDHGEDGTGDKEIGEELYTDIDEGGKPERILFHTAVSEEYAGQGLASDLVQTVVDDVIAGGRAVVPVCPYVAKWLPRHPEYAANVVQPTKAHLDAVRVSQS